MNIYIRILLTVILAVGATLVFSFYIEKGQVNYFVHKDKKMKVVFKDSANYDILFIGSSRTHTTINPDIIDSITGLKSYNAGVEGGNLFEFELTLNGYLYHHPPPKLLVLTIDPFSFNSDREMFFPFQYFNVLDNPEVKKVFKNNKEYKYFFIKYMPFLRIIYYDDYTKSLAFRGLLGQNELSHLNFYETKGFASNGFQCVDTAESLLKLQKVNIDKEYVEKLQNIIETCRKRNIQLFFTYAPEFDFRLQASFSNFSSFLQQVYSLARINNIPFFREDSLSMNNKPCLFANYGHVNTNGAIVYSEILGKRLSDSLSSIKR